MAFFSYKARDGRGQLVEGVLEGSDSAAVATTLLGTGVTPVEIGETAAPRKSAPTQGLHLRKPRVKAVDLLLFSRQMYSLLKAGVPILRALAGLQESTANPAFKDALQKEVKVKFALVHELHVDGQRSAEISFREVKFNSSLDDRLFEKPPGKPFEPGKAASEE